MISLQATQMKLKIVKMCIRMMMLPFKKKYVKINGINRNQKNQELALSDSKKEEPYLQENQDDIHVDRITTILKSEPLIQTQTEIERSFFSSQKIKQTEILPLFQFQQDKPKLFPDIRENKKNSQLIQNENEACNQLREENQNFNQLQQKSEQISSQTHQSESNSANLSVVQNFRIKQKGLLVLDEVKKEQNVNQVVQQQDSDPQKQNKEFPFQPLTKEDRSLIFLQQIIKSDILPLFQFQSDKPKLFPSLQLINDSENKDDFKLKQTNQKEDQNSQDLQDTLVSQVQQQQEVKQVLPQNESTVNQNNYVSIIQPLNNQDVSPLFFASSSFTRLTDFSQFSTAEFDQQSLISETQPIQQQRIQIQKPKTAIHTNYLNFYQTVLPNQRIYATRTGSKYHRNGCRSLYYSQFPISYEQVKFKHLQPCRICRPF